MLVSFDCQDAHGRDGFGNSFREAAEAAVFLEGDFDISVVGEEALLFFYVGFVPC